jgi:hypothetical protein
LRALRRGTGEWVRVAFGHTPRQPMFDTTTHSKRAFSASPLVRTATRAAAPLAIPLVVIGTLLPGCGGGGDSSVPPVATGGAIGSVVAHPDPTSPSKFYTVDLNRGGQSGTLRLERAMWGRLVDIRDIDLVTLQGLGGVFSLLSPADQEIVLNSGALQHVDYPISERIVSDNSEFVLRTNAVTAETTLTILHDADGDDSEDYAVALKRADDLVPIQSKSLDPSEVPPFSVAPRNCAIVLKFDDLLDETTINDQTVKLLTGNPPSTPFTNLRAFPDVNHGDLDSTGVFRPTRIVIDTTVSDIEAQEAAATGQLLQTNALGLPPSVTTGQANSVLRIPTRRFLPSDQLLQNLAGKALSFTADPNTDESSVTLDVVRAFRSGGSTANTGDLNNGYLLDLDPPRIIGAQGVQVTGVVNTGPDEYTASIRYDVDFCALRPRRGDIIQQGLTFSEVTEDADVPFLGTVNGVKLRVVSPIGGTLSIGAGLFQAPYDPVNNQGKETCFVRIQPVPSLDPGPTGAVRGVLTGATASLRFSEPMAPASLTPYDSFTITRVDNVPSANDYVVGRINRTGDLKQFSFVPVLPFAKGGVGETEDYFISIEGGTDGPTDLAGNSLVDTLPMIEFELLPAQSEQNNSGLVLRFDTISELPDSDDAPELRGQFLYDFQRGLIRPRPVTRFTGVADRTQAVPSLMTPTPLGIQTPLSGLGSKLQTVWRNIDVGFGLFDETTQNVDVEGLAWAPKGGSVIQEFYDQFEISLAHSRWLPDETINPGTLFPMYAASGVVPNFTNNLLPGGSDPLTVVHERSRGYLVDSQTISSSTGTAMVRFPWNVGIPPQDRTYYTWRDTSIIALGGPSGNGADPDIFYIASSLEVPDPKPYIANNVPTVGLPLLMEFKCFPSKELGLNGFDTNFAANSSPRPNFRAFSTGGINDSGVPVIKNPDLETIATGGFNPSAGGAGTLTTDNTFYIGQMELVTRISRVYTIWFDTLELGTIYTLPTVEPRPENQPEGTQVVLAYRGAQLVNSAILRTDSCSINPYGNPVNCADPTGTPPAGPAYLNGFTWKEDIADIQGARFVQLRMTFISNAETSLTPVLGSLGLAYSH